MPRAGKQGRRDGRSRLPAGFEGTKHRIVFQTTAGPIGKVTPRMVINYHRMIDVWEELPGVESGIHRDPA